MITLEELITKLKGVMEVTPLYSSPDDTIIVDGGMIKLADGDKLVKCNNNYNIERILDNASLVSGEIIKKWFYSDIPESLLLNSYILSNTAYDIIEKTQDRVYKARKNISSFQYNWETDYWFLKTEFSIPLLNGDIIKAIITIDSSDIIDFDGTEIGYTDLENYLKKFYIITVTENLNNIGENIMKGLDKL